MYVYFLDLLFGPSGSSPKLSKDAASSILAVYMLASPSVSLNALLSRVPANIQTERHALRVHNYRCKRKLLYRTDCLLMGVAAILDGSVVGKGLIPRFLQQAFRWPTDLPSNMVGCSCVYFLLLLWLLDSVNQRFSTQRQITSFLVRPLRRSGIIV
jgi:hypothetical protein